MKEWLRDFFLPYIHNSKFLIHHWLACEPLPFPQVLVFLRRKGVAGCGSGDPTNFPVPIHSMIARSLLRLVPHFLIATGALASSTPTFSETPIFVAGQDGYNTYRIPAIARAGDGALLAFCEGRKNSSSDTGNIDIVMRKSSDNGQTWGPLQIVWDDAANTCGNPAPVVDQVTGKVWLLGSWNLGSDSESAIVNGTSTNTRRVFALSSTDNGATWSAPAEITPTAKQADWTWYATGPGAGIQLTRGNQAGRLLVACDHIVAGTKTYGVHVIHSDDHGATWSIGAVAGSTATVRPNENLAVELRDPAAGGGSRVFFNARDHSGSAARATTYSSDGGTTYSPADFSDAPQFVTPIVQGGMARWRATDTGDPTNRILFSCPNGSSRNRLSIWSSADETATWSAPKVVYEGPSAYSDMTRMTDGRMALLYEKGTSSPYQTITLARFNETWLDTPAPAAENPGAALWNLEETPLGTGASMAAGAIRDVHPAENKLHLTAQAAFPAVEGSPAYGNGHALAFNNNGGLQITDPESANRFDFGPNDSFTIEVVCRMPAGSTQIAGLVAKDLGPTSPSWWLRAAGGKARFLISDTTTERHFYSTATINDGLWHHIAAVRDATIPTAKSLRMYIDGQLSGEIADTTTGSLANGQSLWVGRFNSGSNFTGDIDFVRITPAALAPGGFAGAKVQFDADDDRIPDGFEWSKSGSLAAIGNGDFDGDGMADVVEFAMGTDPLVGDSPWQELTLVGNRIEVRSRQRLLPPWLELRLSTSLNLVGWTDADSTASLTSLVDDLFDRVELLELPDGIPPRMFFRYRLTDIP